MNDTGDAETAADAPAGTVSDMKVILLTADDVEPTVFPPLTVDGKIW